MPLDQSGPGVGSGRMAASRRRRRSARSVSGTWMRYSMARTYGAPPTGGQGRPPSVERSSARRTVENMARNRDENRRAARESDPLVEAARYRLRRDAEA